MSDFVYATDLERDEIILGADEFKHQIMVMRRRVGDQLNLLDGRGSRAVGEIQDIDRSRQQFTLIRRHLEKCRQPKPVHLIIALPRHEVFDNILRRAVELGVSRLTPVLSERSVIRLPESKKIDRKMEHWHQVAIAAIKQSGNPFLPLIDRPVPWNDLEQYVASDCRIVFDPHAKEPLVAADVATADGFQLIFGPEGGLSPGEIELLQKRGFDSRKLNCHTLRLETAVVVVLGLVDFFRLQG